MKKNVARVTALVGSLVALTMSGGAWFKVK
jgi:hypothetical protein